ncbi:MAG: hypothetical protein KAX19_09655, partial [Candidatus Brocadiae bacterium]|nr:hypothetical protein [Candidatus Brocadiia bacterium]
RFYDTTHVTRKSRTTPLHVPVPYDNPEFLRQLREVYRAMYERYADEPLVTVYHGTWSAGPWDEIYHPQAGEPLPAGYTPEKFIQGMIQQLDVLIEEFCLKGKVAELPYSGKYPPKDRIDITGPLTARIVERLGRRSPYIYIQSNGWGMTTSGRQTVSWGHERDINDARGQVNLALQALGTNAGGGWWPQGDWVNLVRLAQNYDVAYLELYPPDLAPLDAEHRIVEAFTQPAEAPPSGRTGTVPDFTGFKPWLRQRGRVLYVREGNIRRTFACGREPRSIGRLMIADDVPDATRVHYRARTRRTGGPWSAWKDRQQVGALPPGNEAEIEARLHTDDGYTTPRVTVMRP